MKIGIVGPGRLGRTLAELLEARGHTIALVGRGARLPRGDAVFLTVPDAALAGLATRLEPGVPALHCSGALPAEVLRPHAPAGCMHPLMTFPGPEVAIPSLEGVPAAVSGDPPALKRARAVAEELGMQPFPAPENRALYHAAAVIAGNFATVLLADGARALAAAGVDEGAAAGMLAPLAMASIAQAAPDPAAALTGPAVRGDVATLARHRRALEAAGLSELVAVYDLLTKRASALRAAADGSDRDRG